MTKNEYILVRLNGVGWNVKYNSTNNELVFQVGYSHLVKKRIPNNIEIKIRSETLLEVKAKGGSKQLLGDFVASIRRIRPWNIYTGHGIVRMDRVEGLIQRRGKRSLLNFLNLKVKV